MDLQALNRQAVQALRSGNLAKADSLTAFYACDTAPLFDTLGFTRGLEATYEDMPKAKG